MEGWVKLFRKLTEWEWYADPNTKALFIHCLLKANINAGVWRGIHYDAGEFITSLPSLCDDLGLTMRQARTALSRLQATGEVTSRTTDITTGKKMTKGRIITVNNWSAYQVSDSQNDSQDDRQTTGKTTGKRQASDNRIRREEDKEEKNIYIGRKNASKFVKPTVDQVREYCHERKNNIDPQTFIDFYDARGWKLTKGVAMKDWKAAVRTWERNSKSDKGDKDLTKTMPMYQEAESKPVQQGVKSPFKGSLAAEFLKRKQEGKLGT